MPRQEEEDESTDVVKAPPRRHLSHDAQSRYMDASEVEAVTDEYVNADSSYDKTMSRIIVERYFQNVSVASQQHKGSMRDLLLVSHTEC